MNKCDSFEIEHMYKNIKLGALIMGCYGLIGAILLIGGLFSGSEIETWLFIGVGITTVLAFIIAILLNKHAKKILEKSISKKNEECKDTQE